VQCAYVDRRRVRCTSARCEAHQVVFGGAPYCPRHAGVVRAIARAPEEEREFPEVDNRAPSLCEWMAESLEPGMLQLIGHYQAQRPGSRLAPEALTVVQAGTPRVRGWEHRWRLVDDTGPIVTVALRVEEPRDSVVIIKINGIPCHEAVPPWISEQGPLTPEADQQRRAMFNHGLLVVVAEQVHRDWEKMQAQAY